MDKETQGNNIHLMQSKIRRSHWELETSFFESQPWGLWA
jgi:hypothetical protein